MGESGDREKREIKETKSGDKGRVGDVGERIYGSRDEMSRAGRGGKKRK